MQSADIIVESPLFRSGFDIDNTVYVVVAPALPTDIHVRLQLGLDSMAMDSTLGFCIVLEDES